MIHGFGDESIDSEIVTYAAAVFSTERTPEAEVILATAKKSVGLSPEVPLHCREVFSGDARKRSPWAKIKAADIYEMVEDLCQKLKGIQHQPVVSVIESRRVPAQPVAPDQYNRSLVEKGIATMAYQAVATALILRFGENGIRLWIDPDSTKIPWGKEHKQVNTTRSFYPWPVMPRPEGRGYKGRAHVDKGICDMIAGQYAQADRTCGLRFEVPLGVGAEVSQIPVGGSYREAVARDL